MVTFNKIDSTKVLYFIWGDSTSVQEFRKETKSEPFLYVPINPVKAIRITDGAFPLFLFIQDGEVQRTADLRQLTEKEVISHLQ